MRKAVEQARQVAPLNIPVLLVGETGTGKEVLAQAIHHWSGRSGQLVDINCGALTDTMVESLLFGHRRGAFTGATETVMGLVEVAHCGTLFLDELSSLPHAGQVKLLRVLETGEVRRVGESEKRSVDLRLISALQPERDHRLAGLIRSDLYYRVSGSVIRLPPLRERSEDLLSLAEHFAMEAGLTVGTGVLRLLERHSWAGNVRELRSVIRRAALLSDTDEVGPGHVAQAVNEASSPVEPGKADQEGRLVEVCRRYHGDRAEVARALGISVATLYRRLRAAGLGLRAFADSQRSHPAMRMVRK